MPLGGACTMMRLGGGLFGWAVIVIIPGRGGLQLLEDQAFDLPDKLELRLGVIHELNRRVQSPSNHHVKPNPDHGPRYFFGLGKGLNFGGFCSRRSLSSSGFVLGFLSLMRLLPKSLISLKVYAKVPQLL